MKRWCLPDPSSLTYVRPTCLSPLFKSTAFLPQHLPGWGNTGLSPRIPQKCWNNYSTWLFPLHPPTGNFECFINMTQNSRISYNVWSLWSICFTGTDTGWWGLFSNMMERIDDSSSNRSQTPRSHIPRARYWAGCSTQAVTRTALHQVLYTPVIFLPASH